MQKCIQGCVGYTWFGACALKPSLLIIIIPQDHKLPIFSVEMHVTKAEWPWNKGDRSAR